MDVLEKTVQAYFTGADSRLLMHGFLTVLGGAAAVFFDRGNRRFNRWQFLVSGVTILLVWMGAVIVIQAAMPTMVRSSSTFSRGDYGSATPVPSNLAKNNIPPPPDEATLFGDQQQIIPPPPPEYTLGPPSSAQEPNTDPKNGWVLMMVDLATCAAAGYGLGLVAMARCRDSFDKNQKTLAMVAVAGSLFSGLVFFVLILRGTKRPEKRHQTAMWDTERETRLQMISDQAKPSR